MPAVARRCVKRSLRGFTGTGYDKGRPLLVQAACFSVLNPPFVTWWLEPSGPQPYLRVRQRGRPTGDRSLGSGEGSRAARCHRRSRRGGGCLGGRPPRHRSRCGRYDGSRGMRVVHVVTLVSDHPLLVRDMWRSMARADVVRIHVGRDLVSRRARVAWSSPSGSDGPTRTRPPTVARRPWLFHPCGGRPARRDLSKSLMRHQQTSNHSDEGKCPSPARRPSLLGAGW